MRSIDWMDNYSSIKEQLAKHTDEINNMEPVAIVEYTPKSNSKLVEIINGEVVKIGGKRMKNSGITFDFDESGAKSINAHAKTNETRAASLASPYVAKWGKLIAGQQNHEGQGVTTVTFAAPVVINEQTVNVGVVVQFAADGRPNAVNVGLQDGGNFKIDMKKASKGHNSRVDRYDQGTTLSTMDASNQKVSQTPPTVKSKNKLAPKKSSTMTKDSNGKTLTEAQAEYFKDSKVRDENGNLRVVYHGTGADFTVFDKSKVGQNYSNRGGDLGFYVSPCIVFRDGGTQKR